jgi:hypothetical protein
MALCEEDWFQTVQYSLGDIPFATNYLEVDAG